MSDEEQQQKAEEVAKKEVILGKTPSRTPKTMDQNAQWQ